ncbi:transcriptional regulator [Streptomyces sp. col6]|uniref:helix-turn-helix transcriptional regulator n=1 Tax=unclassified Streptomyces TaxID=2593676 RepID=UPI0011CE5948|nr:helix-turn-helix domain-containing protein [Streptomyces sp. col6]TXS02797.1 transcriptional regulator [Streptomyces sp. col6]
MSSEDAALDALAVLGDPVRRGLYRYVGGAHGDVTRDAAADAVGVSRATAAFHLDKLVDAGLLEVSFKRLSGRSGPGAGRPSKLYRRADGEHAVSVPPRSYDTASRLLAEVVERAGLDAELQAAARAAGAAADTAGDPLDALRERGYEPFRDCGKVRLNNCPFHALAEEFPALVCGMNLAAIQGLLAGMPGAEGWSAEMDPLPEGCCVALEGPEETGEV